MVEGIAAADSWRFAALRAERRIAPEFVSAGPTDPFPGFARLEAVSPTVADVIFRADFHSGWSAETCLAGVAVAVDSANADAEPPRGCSTDEPAPEPANFGGLRRA